MAMNWKLILLGIAIVVAIIYVSREGFRGSRQGFKNPDTNTFTMYYADWCGHCKKIKPEFETFMKSGPISAGGKSCQIRMISPEKEPDAAAGKPIKGFPTFLMETTDGQVVEYKGERTTAGFLEFINKNLS
jgi:thiol-disulfide isomerase/thioredoxin